MKRIFILVFVLALGAAVLSPAVAALVAALDLDRLPGDFAINQGNFHMIIPVAYSLCASAGLGLFYYFLKG